MFRLYKKSKYNITVPYDNGHLIHNLISGALIFLNNKRFEEFKQIESSFCCLGFRKMLASNKFLVPESDNEAQNATSLFAKNRTSTTFKSFVFSLTDQCNLRCPYCFEHKHDGKPMPEEVQNQTIKFVDHCVRSTPTNKLMVVWYGGEPLLELAAIVKLSKEFAKSCKALNVQFHQVMITNGTLLNQDVINQLTSIGCRHIQITIDGIGSAHNNRRPCIDQSSSYEKVISGLELLKNNGFDVELRTNLDRTNIEEYPALLDLFIKSGYTTDYTQTKKNGGRISPYVARTLREDSFELSHKEVSVINNPLLKYRPKKLGAGCVGGCPEYCPYSFCVSSLGNIVKCWSYITDDIENHTIGTVYDLTLAEKGSHTIDLPNQCENCKYLPICGGGCSYLRLIRNSFQAGCAACKHSLEQNIINAYLSSQANTYK